MTTEFWEYNKRMWAIVSDSHAIVLVFSSFLSFQVQHVWLRCCQIRSWRWPTSAIRGASCAIRMEMLSRYRMTTSPISWRKERGLKELVSLWNVVFSFIRIVTNANFCLLFQEILLWRFFLLGCPSWVERIVEMLKDPDKQLEKLCTEPGISKLEELIRYLQNCHQSRTGSIPVASVSYS